MTNGTKQLQNGMYRIGAIGGGLAIGYAFFEPYMPIIVTVIASLAAGLTIRALFTNITNKKFNQSYRFSGGTAPNPKSGGSTGSGGTTGSSSSGTTAGSAQSGKSGAKTPSPHPAAAGKTPKR
jgi:hypothetical protein